MRARERSGEPGPLRRYATSWFNWFVLHTPLDRLLRNRLCDHCYALSVDDDGVVEHFVDGSTRRHGWDEVRPVESYGHCCVVCLGLHHHRFGWSIPGVRQLIAEIHNRRPGATAAEESVTPEQIAEWMGIEVDELLVVGLPPGQRIVLSAVVAIDLLLVLLGVALRHPYLAMMNLGQLAIMMVLWRAMFRRFTATPWGLRYGNKTARWQDVVGLTHSSPGWMVQTTQGQLYLPGGRNSEPVKLAIQHVLDAHLKGAALPRMTDVPDHALSRAESVEVSSERGLSRSEGSGADEV